MWCVLKRKDGRPGGAGWSGAWVGGLVLYCIVRGAYVQMVWMCVDGYGGMLQYTHWAVDLDCIVYCTEYGCVCYSNKLGCTVLYYVDAGYYNRRSAQYRSGMVLDTYSCTVQRGVQL